MYANDDACGGKCAECGGKSSGSSSRRGRTTITAGRRKRGSQLCLTGNRNKRNHHVKLCKFDFSEWMKRNETKRMKRVENWLWNFAQPQQNTKHVVAETNSLTDWLTNLTNWHGAHTQGERGMWCGNAKIVQLDNGSGRACVSRCSRHRPCRRPESQTGRQAEASRAHLIRIFMHALHCHQGEQLPSCHLRNQHNCAAQQAREREREEEDERAGVSIPVLTPLLHSLGACNDGGNQTFYTWATTSIKWQVQWRVAVVLRSICISSRSAGFSYCSSNRILLLTGSWPKLMSAVCLWPDAPWLCCSRHWGGNSNIKPCHLALPQLQAVIK